MNRKQLTFLIVLGVVLGGLGYYVYNKNQSSYERGSASGEGQKLLQGVPPGAINDVAQIILRQNTNEVILTRQGEQWTVKQRGDYPANFGNISDLLQKFWDLKVTRPVTVGPSRLPQLKLTKTDGTLVELKDEKGKAVVALTLGLQSSKDMPQDSQFGGGSSPNGRYVMRGDDVKSVVLVSDPLTVEAKPEDWLNKDWFKVEKIKSVSVLTTNATNNWKLVRETESGEWKLADAKPGETVDTSKTGAMTWLLSTPAFNDVMVDPKPETTGLEQAPGPTVIETFDGFTYTIKLGRIPMSEDSFALQVRVAGNFPKERAPGKDEKPEDKTRLDKEFADKQKAQQEKLKNEQRFEKRTYVVTKWTVDNLLKERKDFLAEKKEEPKPGEATPAVPPPKDK